jgi:hypothetical protein
MQKRRRREDKKYPRREQTQKIPKGGYCKREQKKKTKNRGRRD